MSEIKRFILAAALIVFGAYAIYQATREFSDVAGQRIASSQSH